MKELPYSDHPCKRHPEHVSATCPECYELALAQQNVQVGREQRRLHREYLERRAA